jgi:hypothetical protein
MTIFKLGILFWEGLDRKIHFSFYHIRIDDVVQCNGKECYSHWANFSFIIYKVIHPVEFSLKNCIHIPFQFRKNKEIIIVIF